ncbi:nitroreductase family protein [Clostridium sp. CCUG 7971]|uniref:nitroreductase family protein n=1 Tax=Clostridium sp. CCUG 7971 TaxID=2811414 RepID=UPI001ABAE55D|nr:nitroreductase family protein [Clostridium sp. CCUG 7971]MBO3446317.1 nitroreductase family protein [Clostridium sp. CCUG 7971]
MNSTIETINNRVSLRRYEEKSISKEHLNLLIESAIKAPTAGNMMMYSIIKVTNKETKKKLSITCDNQPFIKKAPLVLLFVADMHKWYKYFEICDVEKIAKSNNKEFTSPGINDFMLAVNDALIAAQNVVIAAESLGIGSCYIGDIMENYEIHKSLLNLPDYTFPAAMLTLGYYPKDYKKIFRDRFDEKYVVFDEKYKDLNNNELVDMFKNKENNMPNTNIFNAENFGQLLFMRKISSNFALEMNRSINKNIKFFIGENKKGER